MVSVRPARHLLRARDVIDARYADPLTVEELADAAGLSRAYFTRAFTRTFGSTPTEYLQTRRLERAAALLRHTDHAVADICMAVGLRSVGSFTASFGRTYGMSPTAYRAAHPPASAYAMVPACMVRLYARPAPDTRVEPRALEARALEPRALGAEAAEGSGVPKRARGEKTGAASRI